SPYLLQHAHNPVDWFAWGNEALQKAQTEDKPIIVSIGYSACHWCHVMERESFENEALAKLMNENFVCIKVDREERPDVDAIYMDAVQIMGLQGGWPLNVFLTPEGKPFYGGTYFSAEQWGQLLQNIAKAYTEQKTALADSADKFALEIAMSEVKKYRLVAEESFFESDELEEIYQKVSKRFDKIRGGTEKSPKFPMPSIYLFLLRYAKITDNQEVIKHLNLTLQRMALGGIYDQIGGGFARYSVDAEWFAPHFEKMLYDNAQLISLYTEMYNFTKTSLYKDKVYETIHWLRQEMTSPEGAFYSALDADTEGVEGKFYVWTNEQWQAAMAILDLPKNVSAAMLTTYFGIEEGGNWEHGYNILHHKTDMDAFVLSKNIESKVFKNAVDSLKKILLQIRSERIRPGLDDKILCSWNGLAIKGLVDAYRTFEEPVFLEMAMRNATFIHQQMQTGGQLFHSYKNGKSTITAYLEDYAAVIDGDMALYEATFEEKWLLEAKKLTDYVLENFYDEAEDMFFFTDTHAEKLIARKKEIFDNVIPASNSSMAKNLYFLGMMLGIDLYEKTARNMLARMKKLILTEPNYLTNWASLFANLTESTAEIAIVGEKAHIFAREIDNYYLPNKVLMGTKTSSDLPLLENREAIGGKTTIYVCYNRACRLPVFSVAEAISQLKEGLSLGMM
ncbi:MAG: thioredoxin domain-containing protein, partial [Verrucomicrobia bacterium]|nr:thioredoxin domain-containing protein [Cytophagales bacterium]